MKINKQILSVRNIENVLRGLIFIAFYILSLRSVFVYLSYLTGALQLIGMVAVLIGLVLCWWKVTWVLYLFIACIPLVSGIQELGFMKSVPLLSFIFSIIYISWLSKFIFLGRHLRSENIISNLIDILTGVIYLSLIASLCLYPMDYSLYRLQYASIMGQFDPFCFMEMGYVVLQGMFCYRVFELELKDKTKLNLIIPIVYCHAIIVLIFSFQEIIVKMINKKGLFYIMGPFQDIHSYAGYILILFFYFAYLVFQQRRNRKINLLFALSFLLCLFLSGSFSALLSLFFIGFIWGVIGLKKRKKNIFIAGCVIGVLSVSYFLPMVKSDNFLIQKYTARLNYTKYFKNQTATQRFELWDRAVEIIKEFPLTGSGIGSYFKISNYYSNNVADASEFENAHNYYLQFAAELGIPALFLFLLILFFVFREGFQAESSVQSKGLLLGLFAYLFSMLSGHHLILSTHRFLFWFILFAIVYSTNKDFKKKKFNVEAKILTPILFGLVFMVIAGHAFNSFYLEKEVKGLYDYGLYKPQTVDDVKMRWIDRDARRKLHAKTDYFGFTMYAEPENLSSGILEIQIYVNDNLLDRVIWKTEAMKHRNYYIPGIKGQSIKIKMRANDSYNPYKMELSKSIRENRNQSAAMTDIIFFSKEEFKKREPMDCNSGKKGQACKDVKKIKSR